MVSKFPDLDYGSNSQFPLNKSQTTHFQNPFYPHQKDSHFPNRLHSSEIQKDNNRSFSRKDFQQFPFSSR